MNDKNRISRVITRSGDQGQTGLADGSRLAKTELRVEALGCVDELNASLGFLQAEAGAAVINEQLLSCMHDLFELGAELSQPGVSKLDESFVARLDQQAQSLNAQLPPLKEFILPGGSEAVARAHLARTQCRRCERVLWQLHERDGLNLHSLQYLNRLSDLLFIAGRVIAREQGQRENYWQSRK